MRYLLLLFTICSIASCCANKNNSKENVMVQNESNTYIINQLYSDIVIDENVTITFSYTNKTVSGYSGCNNFSGSFTDENGLIKIGPLVSTKKMCPDISSETTLFKALANAEKINIKSSKLELLDTSGETVLKATFAEKMQSKSQEDKITFEYSATSRGFYLTVYVSNIDNMLLVTTHRDMKPARQTYSKKDWDKLVSEISTINLKNLENIEAPSKSHQYDGAAIASLKITVMETVYQTMAFDHGNPPDDIKELVNTLISLSERN